MSEAKKYYTIKQVADRWVCSSTTVQKLIRTGQLACMRIGAAIRIAETAINDYEERKAKEWHDQNLKNQDSNLQNLRENQTGTSSGHGAGNLTAFQRAQKMKSQPSNSL